MSLGMMCNIASCGTTSCGAATELPTDNSNVGGFGNGGSDVGGAGGAGGESNFQKWWNCYIDSNTTYDNSDIDGVEAMWLADGNSEQEAADKALSIITRIIEARLADGREEMENPGEELIVNVLYCEPNS